IIGQVSVSALLLAVGGLFVRGLTSAQSTDRDFVTKDVLIGRVTLAPRYAAERGAEFYENVVRQLESIPGIASVNVAEAGGQLGAGAAKARPTGREPHAVPYSVYIVSRGHFRTLGIPVLAGRDFTA